MIVSRTRYVQPGPVRIHNLDRIARGELADHGQGGIDTERQQVERLVRRECKQQFVVLAAGQGVIAGLGSGQSAEQWVERHLGPVDARPATRGRTHVAEIRQQPIRDIDNGSRPVAQSAA